MNQKTCHHLYAAAMAAALTATLVTTTAHAQTCPSWPTADRFTISGAEVTDKRTGLVWKRCSEGQTLSGNTCTGTATTHTHEAALTLAKNQNSSSSPWRLPNVKELASLADKGCQSPAIDSTAFPNTPNNWYWSSSPYVGGSNLAWDVYFGYGDVYHHGRGSYSQVRLVRASQ